MPEFFRSLYVIIASFVAHTLAQLMKLVILSRKTGKWKWEWHYFFASGGFPSSHASAVMAYIIMYDAMNVRYYAGKNIQITRQLIDDLQSKEVELSNSPLYLTKMKDVLGHKAMEVVTGAMLGAAVAFILYQVLVLIN
jgi:acid phosphatase family membrane protein YuiD